MSRSRQISVCLAGFLALATALATTPLAQEPPTAWVRLHHPHAATVRAELVAGGFDVPCGCRHGDHVDVIVTPMELDALARFGGQLQVVRGFNTDLPPDTRYKTDVEVVQMLQAWAAANPTFCRAVDLSAEVGAPKTVGNRSIWALKISDNPNLDEDEEAVLIYANEHCRELLAIEVALGAIQRIVDGYVANDPTMRQIVDTKEIWVIPNANPDGLAYVWSTNENWRKNRRQITSTTYGVDLNRNFGPGWSSSCAGSTRASSSTYKGPSPFSENETQAITELHKREHFQKVCNHHNYGREVLNPLVCTKATVPSAIYQFWSALDSTMAAQMTYATRDASAEGEGYQWCAWHNGAYAMLVESGTAFQPSWTTVAPEVQRVWPGILWLLQRPVPLTGNVTNRYTGAPVVADVAIQGFVFTGGQRHFSEPKHGRYHYWAPNGTYSVTFTAPGYQPKTVTGVQVTSTGTELDVQLEPSAQIAITGSGKIGTAVTLGLSAPGMANKAYGMHAALGTSPPIDLGQGVVIPLALDFLFLLSPQLPWFANFYGVLDGSAQATATANLPLQPAFVGLRLHHAFVTFDPSSPTGFGHVSAPADYTIQP